jgi:uncharacterized protein (DUF1778 family)
MPRTPFKRVSDQERRENRYEIRLNDMEEEAIQKKAAMRNLSVADYMRRCALGRRADVRYEVEIILLLNQLVQAIRSLHKDLADMLNKVDPVIILSLRTVIDEARKAILRIEK